jgi:1,4-dihydroxy-2-naphthoyl-CoA hydrolase
MDIRTDLLPPFPTDMGIELTETTPARVAGAMTVRRAHANRNGVMHGGAVMAFGDALGGVAAALNLVDRESTTTLESKTNFLRPIALGERITALCVPLHRGRKTHVWQTSILREDGKVAAITTQTQMTLDWSRDD